MQVERVVAAAWLSTSQSSAGYAQLVVPLTCKCSLEDAQDSLAVSPSPRQLHGLASQLKTKAPVNFIGAGHTQARQVPKTEVVSTTSQAKHKRLWVGVGAKPRQRRNRGCRASRLGVRSALPLWIFPTESAKRCERGKQRTCASVRPELKLEQHRRITNP
jgi:hypothetical protein